MKSASIRYGMRFGCRFGQPHDPVLVKETKTFKVERCKICGVRRHWVKGYKERISNVDYLRFHVRSFAQPHGSTKRVFEKTYHPEKTVIHINE